MSGYNGGKDTTDSYLALDVRYLARKGHLCPGASFSLSWSRNGTEIASIRGSSTGRAVELSYRHNNCGPDGWRTENYPVCLTWTRCNYGGERPWFMCPARGCGKRVAILYGGGIFACRHCYQLAYESQREQDYQRALSKAQAIRRRMGGSTGMADDFPAKPKGMHWTTYYHLWNQHDNADGVSWRQFVERLRST
jgi:hypothetical protein